MRGVVEQNYSDVLKAAIKAVMGIEIELKIIFEDDTLIIPHIDMENRDFVLKPMVEINANFRHPILHKTMRQLLDALGE